MILRKNRVSKRIPPLNQESILQTELRLKRRDKAIRAIQNTWRHYVFRANSRRQSANIIKYAFRVYICRKNYLTVKQSVLLVQTRWRFRVNLRNRKFIVKYTQNGKWLMKVSDLVFSLVLGWRIRKVLRNGVVVKVKQILRCIEDSTEVLKGIAMNLTETKKTNISYHMLILRSIGKMHHEDMTPPPLPPPPDKDWDWDWSFIRMLVKELLNNRKQLVDFFRNNYVWVALPRPGYWDLDRRMLERGHLKPPLNSSTITLRTPNKYTNTQHTRDTPVCRGSQINLKDYQNTERESALEDDDVFQSTTKNRFGGEQLLDYSVSTVIGDEDVDLGQESPLPSSNQFFLLSQFQETSNGGAGITPSRRPLSLRESLSQLRSKAKDEYRHHHIPRHNEADQRPITGSCAMSSDGSKSNVNGSSASIIVSSPRPSSKRGVSRDSPSGASASAGGHSLCAPDAASVTSALASILPKRKGNKPHIQLDVISGHNLMPAKKITSRREREESSNSSDRIPYLRASLSLPQRFLASTSSNDSLSSSKVIYQTKQHFDIATLNPTWNHTFYVPLPFPPAAGANENMASDQNYASSNVAVDTKNGSKREMRGNSVGTASSPHHVSSVVTAESALINYWSHGSLTIEVLDMDRFNEDIFLGEVQLLLSGFLSVSSGKKLTPDKASSGDSPMYGYVPRVISGMFPLLKKGVTDRVSGHIIVVAHLHMPLPSSKDSPNTESGIRRGVSFNSNGARHTSEYSAVEDEERDIPAIRGRLISKKLAKKMQAKMQNQLLKSDDRKILDNNMLEDINQSLSVSESGLPHLMSSPQSPRSTPTTYKSGESSSSVMRSQMMMNLTRSMDSLATAIQGDAEAVLQQFSRRLQDKVESDLSSKDTSI